MLMLDHHIHDGVLTPRQDHEQCEGAPIPPLFPTEIFIYLFIYLFNKDWVILFNKIYNYKDTLHKARGISNSPCSFRCDVDSDFALSSIDVAFVGISSSI